jgi:hypothetical protein
MLKVKACFVRFVVMFRGRIAFFSDTPLRLGAPTNHSDPKKLNL